MKLTLPPTAGVFATASILFAAVAYAHPPHPYHPLLNDFGGHFRCPHAKEWLQKGPEQAAKELGLTLDDTLDDGRHARALQQQGGPPPGVFGNPSAAGGEGPPTTCQVAPGVMGGAHQAGFSAGYGRNCPGTPAEGSPYMWPPAWSAGFESKSMSYGSDDINFHAIGNLYYRLDKNWRRQDFNFQRGVLRAVGSAPCAPENVVAPGENTVEGCRRDSDLRTTMIHRGPKLYFITWRNGTLADDIQNIQECSWVDFKIVGTVRPDWFLDSTGVSADVQYLGKQHVFHDNQPRLVTQFRKSDFSNQYFTSSILANPKEDGIHWPMILNIPGEGFGDDVLQQYTNHTMLTDEDDHLFLLDQAFEAAGGACPELVNKVGVEPPAEGEAGPPRSNLEVDPNSWISNEYTYSPVWEPPAATQGDDPKMEESPEAGHAITNVGATVVASCYDSSTGAVDLTFSFPGVIADGSDQVPWISVGYRETEECLMTPRGGGNSDFVLITSTEDDEELSATLTASLGSLSPDPSTSDIPTILSTLVPLSDAPGFSMVQLSHPEALDKKSSSTTEVLDDLKLKFQQSMPEIPVAMNLMYAIGDGPQFGYHVTRECFQLTKFPPCPAADEKEKEDIASQDGVEVDDEDPFPSGATPMRSASILSAAFASLFFTLM